MKQKNRLQKAGEMLMDVVKYLITVGLIGSFLSDRLNALVGLSLIGITFIIFLIAFFTIPPESEV